MHNSERRFKVGLDLGQKQDRSALVIVERVEAAPFFGDPRQPSGLRYHMRHLERFEQGMPYTSVAERVAERCYSPELFQDMELIVDATGVGSPVVEMLRKYNLPLTPVVIKANGSPTFTDGQFTIAKKDLTSNLEILLETEQLKFASALPGVDLLIKELLAFRVKRNLDSGFETFGAWRSGEHDDLVLALALACWYASHSRQSGRAMIL